MTEARSTEVDGADPLHDDPRVAAYFGPSWPAILGFHDLLVSQGELRGLVGPRELPRLWERHLLNSAAVVPFLPTNGRIVDVGSGAGLPGIVVAAMVPGAEVVLLEPMERRTDWLSEVASTLHLDNVVVLRGRAQDVHGDLVADAVTVRAVASLDKLYRWALPLLRAGGTLVAMKGSKAEAEVEEARHIGRKLGAGPAAVLDAPTIEGVDVTRVVRVVREAVPGVR
ncbi:16S rRNA (guanine(527)-N(7))-methyltransferase RsmG [Cellulomonas sp. McL0617]|uniref:16S rRNA (guanine(527)-N(7))-methyltransferase RsmG n=1 Tax=Cellulomonas sp. McL0617 TaxID=3415675 RepID=UPI003CFA618A